MAILAIVTGNNLTKKMYEEVRKEANREMVTAHVSGLPSLYCLVSAHCTTYFKTTCAMRANTIRCISMITSITGAYGIQRLGIISH